MLSPKSPLALASLLLSSLASASLVEVRENDTKQGTFTPHAFLSAPRRSAGVPNDAGTLALYTSSTFNFTTSKRTYGTYVLNTTDGTSTKWSDAAISDVSWLEGTNIVFLQGEDDGSTTVQIADAKVPGKR